MKNITLLGLLLSISACAPTPTHAPDGRKAHALDCSGYASDWNKCRYAAEETCGASGYDILSRSSEDSASFSGNSTGVAGGKANLRNMLIACKTPNTNVNE